MTIAAVVYVLCALTSLLCAALLFRAWRATGTRLLLWSALCFAGIMLHNMLLIVDVHIGPGLDLAIVRLVPALIGVSLLLYGLIWESDR